MVYAVSETKIMATSLSGNTEYYEIDSGDFQIPGMEEETGW